MLYVNQAINDEFYTFENSEIKLSTETHAPIFQYLPKLLSWKTPQSILPWLMYL